MNMLTFFHQIHSLYKRHFVGRRQYADLPKNKKDGFGHLLFIAVFVLFIHSLAFGQSNLALGKRVESSSLLDPNFRLTNLVDGDRTTFTATADTKTGPPNGEWFCVDLGADFYIENINLVARNSRDERRFEIITWPSALGFSSPPSANPDYYTRDSRFNRFLYQDRSGEGDNQIKPPHLNLGVEYPNGRQVYSVNVGVHKARYVMVLTIKDELLLLNELEVFESVRPAGRDFVNGSFEAASPQKGIFMVNEGLVGGWSTTEEVAMSQQYGDQNIYDQGSLIEFWENGYFDGRTNAKSDEGNYFAELNAFTNGMLEQWPICVLPNETFKWAFSHRGRWGVDVMALRINDVDVAQFSDFMNGTYTHKGVVLENSTTTIESTTIKPNDWTRYVGTWTNRSPNPIKVTFGFRAISTGGGDIGAGNFIDDVSIVSLSALLRGGAGVGAETISAANLPKLLVNGEITAPTSVKLTITGGTATRGLDYTTSPATGPIIINIPAGSYDGTPATGISLAPYIQVIADNLVGEPDETIIAQLTDPGNGIVIADAKGCTADPLSSLIQYTIIDQSTPFQANFVQQSPKCHNDADGSITASVAGGSGNFSYNWLSPVNQTGSIATGLVAGDYQVEIRDINTNKAVTYIRTLSQPDQNDAVATITGTTTPSASDGSIDIVSSGGALPKTYAWKLPSGNSINTQNLSNVAQGVYHLTITDANGCTFEQDYTVSRRTGTTLMPIADVCGSATTVTLQFGSVKNDPSVYSIAWNPQSIISGFSNVHNQQLDGTTKAITVALPSNLQTATYGGTVTVSDTSGNDSSTLNFQFSVSAKPGPVQIQLNNQ